jgi:hypothetical protein
MQVMEPFQLVRFKSSVLAQQCEKIGEQILNYQKYIDPIGGIRTNRGGWQSRFPQHIAFPFYDGWVVHFGQLLINCYRDYVEKFYEKRYRELYSDRGNEQGFTLFMWLNINWPGDYNLEHLHTTPNPQPGPPSYLNEFYYLSPEMKDDREFWLPQAFGNFYVTDSDNTFFVTEVPHGPTKEEERTYIDLNAGDFIIGHPSINHGASENKQGCPRITIAYNFEPNVPNASSVDTRES